MGKTNNVFIATSIDGYISDKNGSIDFLHQIPNPKQDDMGYNLFMSKIDALIMGRNTFETVLGFDIEWPYQKPVFVLSNTLKKIPTDLARNVYLVSGSLTDVLNQINELGYHHLYIDGGKTIQSFLEADLIDNLIITTIPVLLGGGTPLFSNSNNTLHFRCSDSIRFLDKIVQNHYTRINT